MAFTVYEQAVLDRMDAEKVVLEEIRNKLIDPVEHTEEMAVLGQIKDKLIDPVEHTEEMAVLGQIRDRLPDPTAPDPVPVETGNTEFEQTVLDRLANFEGIQIDFFAFIHDVSWITLGAGLGLIAIYFLMRESMKW